MAGRKCCVSFVGADGVRREVQVDAGSVYDAAMLALQALKKESWVEALAAGTKFRIEVRGPSVLHEVTLHQLRKWSESSAITPEDKVRKGKLRDLLAATETADPAKLR